MLTKKQKIMFVIFAFMLLQTMINFIYFQDINIVISNLPLLLFLASLYLDKNINSRYITLLSGIVIIVYKGFNLILNSRNIFTMSSIFEMFLMVSIFLFIKELYSRRYYRKEIKLIVLSLSGIYILRILSIIFNSLIKFFDFDFVTLLSIGNYLALLTLPVSVIAYMYIKDRQLY